MEFGSMADGPLNLLSDNPEMSNEANEVFYRNRPIKMELMEPVEEEMDFPIGGSQSHFYHHQTAPPLFTPLSNGQSQQQPQHYSRLDLPELATSTSGEQQSNIYDQFGHYYTEFGHPESTAVPMASTFPDAAEVHLANLVNLDADGQIHYRFNWATIGSACQNSHDGIDMIPGNNSLLESSSSAPNGETNEDHQNPPNNEGTESAAEETNTTGNGQQMLGQIASNSDGIQPVGQQEMITTGEESMAAWYRPVCNKTNENNMDTQRDSKNEVQKMPEKPKKGNRGRKGGEGSQGRGQKPDHTYIELIAMAIRAQDSQRATLTEIYNFLRDRFEFFRGTYNGWKNSIRHNLSLGGYFEKLPKNAHGKVGKGHHWTFGPNYWLILEEKQKNAIAAKKLLVPPPPKKSPEKVPANSKKKNSVVAKKKSNGGGQPKTANGAPMGGTNGMGEVPQQQQLEMQLSTTSATEAGILPNQKIGHQQQAPANEIPWENVTASQHCPMAIQTDPQFYWHWHPSMGQSLQILDEHSTGTGVNRDDNIQQQTQWSMAHWPVAPEMSSFNHISPFIDDPNGQYPLFFLPSTNTVEFGQDNLTTPNCQHSATIFPPFPSSYYYYYYSCPSSYRAEDGSTSTSTTMTTAPATCYYYYNFTQPEMSAINYDFALNGGTVNGNNVTDSAGNASLIGQMAMANGPNAMANNESTTRKTEEIPDIGQLVVQYPPPPPSLPSSPQPPPNGQNEWKQNEG